MNNKFGAAGLLFAAVGSLAASGTVSAKYSFDESLEAKKYANGGNAFTNIFTNRSEEEYLEKNYSANNIYIENDFHKY